MKLRSTLILSSLACFTAFGCSDDGDESPNLPNDMMDDGDAGGGMTDDMPDDMPDDVIDPVPDDMPDDMDGADAGDGGNMDPEMADAGQDAGMEDGGDNNAEPDAAADAGDGDPATSFTLTIENISGDSARPTPISPGVVLVSTEAAPLFTTGETDRGDGLVEIAEDGNAAVLAASLAAADVNSVLFNTPEGANNPGPAFPGGSYEIEFTATPEDGNLNFATMLVQTNDIFIAPNPEGIPLFDGDGNPLAERDISDMAPLWDVGSEVNEAPGHGPNQAPRQAAANTGAAEGVVAPFTDSTQQMPISSSMVSVEVSLNGSDYEITITNVSADNGAFVTPFSQVAWAIHNDNAALFSTSTTASPGLEQLAEDGTAVQLVAELDAANNADIAAAGTAGDPGPLQTISFTVTPTADHPFLSFASMLIFTNDAFHALDPAGIKMLDTDGFPRNADEIEDEIRRRLAVWDAGTEENEIPGAGFNQPPRQAGPNTGVTTTDNVSLLSDPTNDWDALDEMVNLTITQETANPPTFNVTLTSLGEGGESPVFPGLTPVFYAVHNDQIGLFEVGQPASAGLESLAEDGATATFDAELTAADQANLVAFGTATQMAPAMGPILPGGGSYSFVVAPDMDHPYLSIATMAIPSNDTFLAFGPSGLKLLNDDGTPRTDEEIALDIAGDFIAWDAGTEQNQAGAAGRDQAPQQAGPNTGAGEGDGMVRLLSDVADEVWSYPTTQDVVRITIRPTN